MPIDINKIPPVLDMVLNDPKYPVVSGAATNYKYSNVKSPYPIMLDSVSTYSSGKPYNIKRWHLTFYIDDKESPKLLETLDILKQLGLKVNKFEDGLRATKEIDVFGDSDVVGIPPNEMPYVVCKAIESVEYMFLKFGLQQPRVSKRYEDTIQPIHVDYSAPFNGVTGMLNEIKILNDWSKIYNNL